MWVPEEVLDHGEYEAAFSNLLKTVPTAERRLAEDRLRAGALWARLRRLTAEQRMTVISTNEAYHSFALLDRLLGECLLLRTRPVQYQEVATAAVVVAVRLSPARYSAAQRADRYARAQLELANAARINMDFRTAAQALQNAALALSEGSGDPLEQARLLSYEGSLWVDLGQFEKGTECFLKCFEIYDALSERHLMGRALVKQAHAVGQLEPEKAISLLKQAMGYIDALEEPALELAARHNLAMALCGAGRPEEALSMLEYGRSLL
jgi:tetratricopeptide (TPR) repeat protein